MKTFIVETCNWQQRIEIDDSAIEKYPDMAAEAMTLAIERINNNEAENLMEEFVNEMFGVGPEMSAWVEDDGAEKIKITLLTESVFWNAGCHEAAEAMEKAREGLR